MKMTSWRSRISALVVVVVAGAGFSLIQFTGAAPAAQTPQLQGFHLRAAHSAKDAGVAGGATTAGAAVVQETPSALNSQGWVPLPFGTAWVFVNLNTNMVMTVQGGSTANGAAVLQEPWAGTPSQIWFLYPFGSTQTVFINFHSGKAMDVAGGSVSDGAAVIQWTWHAAPNQVWQGVPVGVPTSTTSTSSTTTTAPTTTTTLPPA